MKNNRFMSFFFYSYSESLSFFQQKIVNSCLKNILSYNKIRSNKFMGDLKNRYDRKTKE